AARRLKLAREFHGSAEFQGWRRVTEYWAPKKPDASTVQAAAAPPKAPPQADMEQRTCISCKNVMRVPKRKLTGTEPVNVRCPNPDCNKVLKITPKEPKPPKPDQVGD